MALYWSPEACRSNIPESDKAIQCEANSFGFTVHGLWPNGPDRVHPRYCRPSPPMSVKTVKANLCMTPSPWLLQHEWQAHGTCQWATPEAYFRKARQVRSRLNVPVVARGAGTGLSGGAMPHRMGVTLSMARFNLIKTVDPISRTAVVQCGVRNLAISEAAAPLGLYYAPDPSSQIACTIGGNVAENSGGVHCLKYGLTVHNVLRVRGFTAEGEPVEFCMGLTRDRAASKAWYMQSLGLPLAEEDDYGCALDMNGTLLRITQIDDHTIRYRGYDVLTLATNAFAAVNMGQFNGPISQIDFLDGYIIAFVLAFIIGPWQLSYGQTALVLLEAVLKDHPDDLSNGYMYCLMADTYKRMGKQDEALDSYTKAVWTESPDDVLQYALDSATAMLQELDALARDHGARGEWIHKLEGDIQQLQQALQTASAKHPLLRAAHRRWKALIGR